MTIYICLSHKYVRSIMSPNLTSNAMRLTTVHLHMFNTTHFTIWTMKTRASVFQSGVCGCEKGFTEVMTSHGFLDYCTRTPGSDQKKADVKTSARHPRPEHARNALIHDWALQPLGPGTTASHGSALLLDRLFDWRLVFPKHMADYNDTNLFLIWFWVKDS